MNTDEQLPKIDYAHTYIIIFFSLLGIQIPMLKYWLMFTEPNYASCVRIITVSSGPSK